MRIGAPKGSPDAVIVNATCLGRRLDGIGAYTLGLLRELARTPTARKLVIYLNREAAEHVAGIGLEDRWPIRWVSGRVAPDNGSSGHVLRLLQANVLALRHPGSVVFAMSQIEACWLKEEQVVTVHDVIPLLFPEWNRRQHAYFRHVLPRALRIARAVVCPSHHTKSLVVARYGLQEEKIHVIPHGVPEPHPRSKNAAEEPEIGAPFLLYLGRVAPLKNIDGLIRAFRQIRERVPHRLVIAGSGADGLAGDDRIVFVGPVSGGRKAALIEKASMLILPSFYEGFGLPPLEAMASGCPVVVSRVGSLPEVCGDAAFYVDPRDPRSIARGMMAVLTDAPLRQQMIERGRERAARFRWRESAQRHLQVIEDVLADGRSGRKVRALLRSDPLA